MNVVNACSRPAVAARPSATLAEVAELMRERNVGAVVIAEGLPDRPVPIGVVTDRDIVQAQLEHTADLSRLSAGQIMSHNPLVIDEESAMEDAIGRMRARQVRRAPVVAADGALVGLISTDDLIACVTQELLNVVSALGQRRP